MPSTTGGYVYPTSGEAGYINTSQGIPFYQGTTKTGDIPAFQRDYNLARATITRITEGDPSMMKILFDMMKKKGAFVTNDPQPRWYLEHEPHQRFYLKTQANQGGTTGSAVSTGDFYLNDVKDAPRLQKGDFIILNSVYVAQDRNASSVICDYDKDDGGSDYRMIRAVATPVPEICEVNEVNYTTGKVSVTRNWGGDLQTSSQTGPGFTVAADIAAGSTKTDPGANTVRAADAFFINMGNSIYEMEDDQLIWSLSNTWDYNYVQRVLRKWGSNDFEEKIQRRGSGWQNTFQKNAQDAINAFWKQMEWLFLFGSRKYSPSSDGRYRGFLGGLIETIPSDHVEVMYAPDYSSYSTKQGSFNIPYFNYIMESKGYYGSKEKFLLAGGKFVDAFMMMINHMTQNIPDIREEWTVKGKRFTTSRGLTLNIVHSELMSLNGLDDRAILFDPETIQYGYMGEDIKIVSPLPTTNIHVKSGEIFGDITAKRVNPDANWMFIVQTNNQS